MAEAPHRKNPAYGDLSQPKLTGGAVEAVEAGSPAQEAGLLPGDRLLTADGLALRDVIDWAWIADDDEVEVLAERGLGRDAQRFLTVLDREPGRSWGLSFERPVFDRIRTCVNDCAFCFMTQLPPGLRPSLYLRDDDYRLSFLSGTFVTLTNLTDADVTRIEEQRLSPLHVSLHAVTPDVRAELVCSRGDDRALERFDELVAAGIELHAQVVLVPGVNDGAELESTLAWLWERSDAVASVGVVPLGYTGHQQRFEASYEEPEVATAVLAQLARWQDRARAERQGHTWVQAADELYLAAGLPLPPAEDYDGYPQYENGIGMVRAFVDEWAAARGAALVQGPPLVAPDATLVTGELFAPVLEECIADLGTAGAGLRVLAVRNDFLGGNVNVAGLLTGADLVPAIAADASMGGVRPYLLCDLALNDDGLTLDGMTAVDVATRAAANVTVVDSSAAGLLEALGLGPVNPQVSH